MTGPVTRARNAAREAEISAPDKVLAIAILLAGGAAASRDLPMLWLVTPVMAGLVRYAARQATSASLQQPSEERGGTFPSDLQHAVDAATEQLRSGEARQLLADVIRQARPLFAKRESAFDARMERDTRSDVTELVTAVCETALELSRLDGAAPERSAGDLSARYQRAREELVTRLRDAATALSEMYASGVEHGTPASDRVAELANEVRTDARARRAAVDELSA